MSPLAFVKTDKQLSLTWVMMFIITEMIDPIIRPMLRVRAIIMKRLNVFQNK